MDRASNRRQFLAGQSAANALTDLVGRVSGGHSVGDQAATVEADTYLVQLGRRAMACQFEVFLNAGQHAAANEAALAALDLIDRLESQLTVYRDTSDVMRVNRMAAEAPVALGPELFALLSRADALRQETEGAFDITAGPLAKVWGFYRRAGELPTPEALGEALTRVGGQRLSLDPSGQCVRFERPGMELNLGAIGKGYALDCASRQMLAAGVENFLWHGGQSSVLARGTRAGQDEDRQGWLVSVRHPLFPDRTLAEIRLVDKALGTSGSGSQFFRHQGKRYGHILDPRTGWPAEGVYSATVVAESAADADALATACYVAGPGPATELCRRRPEIGLLMLVPGSAANSVEIVAEGLSNLDWRLVAT